MVENEAFDVSDDISVMDLRHQDRLLLGVYQIVLVVYNDLFHGVLVIVVDTSYFVDRAETTVAELLLNEIGAYSLRGGC